MVYMLLGKGFEETEAIAPVDLMRRAGITVLTVGIDSKTVTGSHGIAIEADITLPEMDLNQMEMLVLPGGLGGVASILESSEAMNAISFAWRNDKYIGAICAAPTILAKLGITSGKHATCYPDCAPQMGNSYVDGVNPAVTDGKLITAASAGCAIAFGLALITALKGDNAAKAVEKQIVIR